MHWPQPQASAPRTAAVLCVEDDEDQLMLLRAAWERTRLPNPLKVVPDGLQAMHYLSGQGRYANRSEFPLPALVVLDLHMPYRSGFDVLTWIRQRPDMATLPVVIHTSSESPEDREKSRTLGAHDFVVKRLGLPHLLAFIHTRCARWLSPTARA